MSGAAILSTVLSIFIESVLDQFAARPIMWGAFFVLIVAITFASWNFLERKGWIGVAWSMLSVSMFALVLALK